VPWFGLFIERQMEGATKSDFLTGAFNCSLHTASQTPNVDTDDFFNDWSATEVTGTNYTALGVVLGSKTSVYDTATDEWRFDAADAVWTTATIASIRYALVWENTAGVSSTDPLVSYYDLGAQSVTAANFTVQWDATGIAKIDVT
jgi:hypothetical protein